jgi:hypothetical protein
MKMRYEEGFEETNPIHCNKFVITLGFNVVDYHNSSFGSSFYSALSVTRIYDVGQSFSTRICCAKYMTKFSTGGPQTTHHPRTEVH